MGRVLRSGADTVHTIFVPIARVKACRALESVTEGTKIELRASATPSFLIGVRGLATGTAYVKSVRMCVRVWVLRRGSGGPLGN